MTHGRIREMISLEHLRKIAQSATQGPWEHDYSDGWGRGVLIDESRVQTNHTHGTRSWSDVIACAAHGYDYQITDDAFKNMQHIATFNPLTILALLDSLEEAMSTLRNIEELEPLQEFKRRALARTALASIEKRLEQL